MNGEESRRLLTSWLIALEAENFSKDTITNYRRAVGQFLTFADGNGDLDLTDAEPVRMWLAALRDKGLQGSTMQVKLAAVRSFAGWLVEEGELTESGAHHVAWPKVDEKAPAALTPEQRDTLIKTCDRTTFAGVRDEAIISLMFDSLLRSNELLSMTADDLDLRDRTVHVRRGKGGRERWSVFGVQTARRIDRYARRRERHQSAGLDAFWLALGRGPLTYRALYSAITRRGERAGLDVHPHMTRAGGAIDWRRKDGSLAGLMTIAGWKDVKMVQRYTKAAEQQLAIEEARRLHEKS